MEVLLTIAIVGMSLAPAFLMQATAVENLYRSSRLLRLLFPIKNFWLESSVKGVGQQEDEKPGGVITQKKELTSPRTTLTYKLSPLGKKSVLKDFKGLHKAETFGRVRNERESFVGFVYVPEKKKK